MSYKHIAFVAAIVLLMVILGRTAYPLSMPHPNDEPFKSKTLPPTLVSLINEYPRTYGFLSDMGDYHFYFAGNTKNLNAFLARLAKVKDMSLSVSLSPGPGRTRDRQGFGRKPPIKYNWYVHAAVRRILTVTSRPTSRAASASRNKAPARWECVYIHVGIAVDGNIDLGKVELPLAYEGFVGGRIGSLVNQHNGRRKRAAKDKPSRRDTRPTSEQLLRSFGAFGDGTGDDDDDE